MNVKWKERDAWFNGLLQIKCQKESINLRSSQNAHGNSGGAASSIDVSRDAFDTPHGSVMLKCAETGPITGLQASAVLSDPLMLLNRTWVLYSGVLAANQIANVDCLVENNRELFFFFASDSTIVSTHLAFV
ncbi:hypothetical protein XENOCAPTIV_010732 [Xenoophorus captivus]|uniref:Uncharacterized protein n=1 Tax=Xenoophorus captivus TaxID=1517983 RepID=A0ABV0RQV2_9TELE